MVVFGGELIFFIENNSFFCWFRPTSEHGGNGATISRSFIHLAAEECRISMAIFAVLADSSEYTGEKGAQSLQIILLRATLRVDLPTAMLARAIVEKVGHISRLQTLEHRVCCPRS